MSAADGFMYEGEPTIPEGQTIAAYRAAKVAARIAARRPRYPGAVLAFIAAHPVPRPKGQS